MKMIKVGQKVRFDPFEGVNMTGMLDLHRKVIGTVKYINEPHNWFSVEYDSGAGPQRISFNFMDVDRIVHICK